MKILMPFVFCLFLVSCVSMPEPSKYVQNPMCINKANYVKVSQIIPEGMIVYMCQYCSDTYCKCTDYTKYLIRSENTKNYVDGDLVKVDDDKCLATDKPYSYTSVMGATITIRELKIINNSVPNENYEQLLKEKEEKDGSVDWSSIGGLGIMLAPTLLILLAVALI